MRDLSSGWVLIIRAFLRYNIDMERLAGIYTIQQAAALLGLTPGSVRHLISRGRLATIHIGESRQHLVTQEEIDRYQRERVSRGRPRKPPAA